jgi:hypothetical protein
MRSAVLEELLLMSTRIVVLVCTLALAACGGDDTSGDDTSGDDTADDTGDDTSGDDTGDDSTPACGDLAGTWEMGGTCGDDECTITQSGCGITAVNCTSGAQSTSGSLDGNDFDYVGTSGGGIPATCSGVLSGDTITGTCDVSGVGTCTFEGDRQ